MAKAKKKVTKKKVAIVKGSPEWLASKEEARRKLDGK